MTETAAPSRPSREEAVAVALAGGEPSWLTDLRRLALSAYREAPWPSSGRDEDWRRTPQIDRLDPGAFEEPPEESAVELPGYLTRALLGPLASDEVLGVVPTDERGDLATLLGEGQPRSDVARGLGDGLRTDSDGWQEVMGQVTPAGLRKLVALNTVLTRGGACLHVARGQEPSGYVRLLQGVGEGRASFPRTLIHLEEGASLTVVEEWLSEGDGPSLLAPVCEVDLAPGSHLTQVVLQTCGPRAVVQSTLRVRQGRDSRYDLRWAMLGASWQKTYFETLMAGQGSQARLVGLDVGRDRQHCDLQTLQDHIAQGAVSDLLHRVAVTDRARSVYAGLIRVEEGAQKTNAYVQNRNLLLGPQAKADSNPTLEILANDVRCTHGSTAGRIDDNQLFYCESRGIEREAASRLITEGFFADVVDSFPEGAPREHLRQLLQSALAEVVASPPPPPQAASA